MKNCTKHAVCRIKQRRIPESLIREVLKRGRRTLRIDRQSIEYRLKNVLGLHGVNLVVVTSPDGTVITSYVEKITVRNRP